MKIKYSVIYLDYLEVKKHDIDTVEAHFCVDSVTKIH